VSARVRLLLFLLPITLLIPSSSALLGDNLVIPTAVMHQDAEMYPEPSKYKFDRFTPNAVFVKDGRKCAVNLMVFAEGKHKCPGRYFAMNELKV